jgi:hypothetical protein
VVIYNFFSASTISGAVYVSDEIAVLKNTLANRNLVLRQIIEQKTGAIYNSKNPEEGIQRALQYFCQQLNKLQNQIMTVKTKDLVGSYLVNVSTEGKIEEDIAKTATSVYGQIRQSYSKVEQFMQESEIVNNMLKSDNTARGKNFYREVDKIWLYPVPGNYNNFYLSVIARFKMARVQDQPIAVSLNKTAVLADSGKTKKSQNQSFV